VASSDDEATRAGPAPGFDDLYRREQRAMVRLAVLLVGSVPAAEDIVQDAFAAVSTRWEDLDRPGAYLRTSVVNGCRMALRRRDTDRRLNPPAAIAPVELPTDLVELRDALAVLPERQRTVLVLRYLLDVSDAEIAETLSCRAATVRSIAHRALARLRKELT
jgi:RNA polymerase sigma-70 factor (sigma-E family)